MIIEIKDILCDDEFNCRGPIPAASVLELMRSIKEMGLIQPITVHNWNKGGYKYRIVCGHRRFNACVYLDHKTIEANVLEDTVNLETLRFINLTENLHRKEMNILEEAKAVLKLRQYGFTFDRIAKEVTKSMGWVQVRADLLTLPPEVQAEAAVGFITHEQIRALASVNRDFGTDAVYQKVRELKDIDLQGGDAKKVKIKEVKKRRPDPSKLGPRTKEEIDSMMELLINTVGYGLHTRVLAWSQNTIKNQDLMQDLKDMKPDFVVPENYATSEF